MQLMKIDEDTKISINEPYSISSIICRICHDEEEEEKTTSMESPCACSGTLKFAHRACIQRWCEEKGSTICEICLQKFEPGYTVPPKLALLDIAVTIRGSLEVPRLNYEGTRSTGLTAYDYPECSNPSHTTANFFRSVALFCMILVLARHLIIILTTGEGNYPFSLATVVLLRASGILLPFYIILKIITAIQNAQQRHMHSIQLQLRREALQLNRVEEEEEPQISIQVQP